MAWSLKSNILAKNQDRLNLSPPEDSNLRLVVPLPPKNEDHLQNLVIVEIIHTDHLLLNIGGLLLQNDPPPSINAPDITHMSII